MRTEFKFKTSPLYYEKERLDIKNNTVREIDLSDERFTQLIAWMHQGWNDGEIKIKIIDAFNHDKWFIRDIRDICIWNSNLTDYMIITWKKRGNEI